MTVGNDSIAAKSEGPFYVRLQNLPADSCQNRILDFFEGLPVHAGGVSVHRNCAFVAFDTLADARLAVSNRDQRVLGGKTVRVTVADRNDVRRTRLCDVRRQLVPECWAAANGKKPKRIRPTMVTDCGSAAKNFCPDEIEFPGIESCSGDGKVPGNAPESCVVDEKVPVNAQELCLVVGKIPGNAPESCLVNGKVPRMKNESLLYDNVPGKNESCLLDGNVSRKQNESYLLRDNDLGSNYESCVRDGYVPGNNNSCFLDGKVSVMVSKSSFPDRKVPVKFADVNFQVQKTIEPVKRMPTKKTIKPTPVFTLSQFKLVYEGTVF